MELTKKIFNIAASFAIVVLSISIFIYSIRDNKAMAAAPEQTPDGYVVASGYMDAMGNVYIMGYNPKTKDAKVLAVRKKALRDFNE